MPCLRHCTRPPQQAADTEVLCTPVGAQQVLNIGTYFKSDDGGGSKKRKAKGGKGGGMGGGKGKKGRR